ncbi:unnamed protein product [Caenorhabditis auriculariae]|uniref:Uncharacterized protein n=1 Tax=Caenorhabditis auriculariae TaxID=2777116 RepID=A0A8S1H1U0_9PELO|nr:unnamed protein product [Caenorhabditis auriculariae]
MSIIGGVESGDVTIVVDSSIDPGVESGDVIIVVVSSEDVVPSVDHVDVSKAVDDVVTSEGHEDVPSEVVDDVVPSGGHEDSPPEVVVVSEDVQEERVESGNVIIVVSSSGSPGVVKTFGDSVDALEKVLEGVENDVASSGTVEVNPDVVTDVDDTSSGVVSSEGVIVDVTSLSDDVVSSKNEVVVHSEGADVPSSVSVVVVASDDVTSSGVKVVVTSDDVTSSKADVVIHSEGVDVSSSGSEVVNPADEVTNSDVVHPEVPVVASESRCLQNHRQFFRITCRSFRRREMDHRAQAVGTEKDAVTPRSA